MDPAVAWEGRAAGRGRHHVFPFVQWQGVLFLPNGPLDKGCPWPAAGYHCRAESGPGTPLRRWETLLSSQTAWLQCGKGASSAAPRLQTSIHAASSTFTAFKVGFFSSSMYELTNISRRESCCKLKATNISS